MTTTLTVGDRFPNVTLPNQDGEPITLSSLTQPALVDHYLGFADGFLRLAAIHFRIIMLDSTARSPSKKPEQGLPRPGFYSKRLSI